MNNQLPLGLSSADSLQVHSVFRTIQGEGPFSGSPALFVRLQGCNLQCPFCDTEYSELTSTSAVVEESQMANWISSLLDIHCPPNTKPIDLLVVTGGEPFRQKATAYFINQAIMSGRFNAIQIETNGTLWDSRIDWAMFASSPLYVVVSPKSPRICACLTQAHPNVYFKYVVEAGKVDSDDGLPTSVLGLGKRVARPWEASPNLMLDYDDRIYVSPMDAGDPVKNQANVQTAVDVCMKFGYRLNLQVHKIVGLP